MKSLRIRVGSKDLLLHGASAELYSWITSERPSPLVRHLAKHKNRIAIALGHPTPQKRVAESKSVMTALLSEYPDFGPYTLIDILSEFQFDGKFYPGYRDHVCHQLKVYLLGLYLYENITVLRQALDRVPSGASGEERISCFRKTWLLTALYHDIGYVIENSEASQGGATWERTRDALNDAFKTPLSTIPAFSSQLSRRAEQRFGRSNSIYDYNLTSLEELPRFRDVDLFALLAAEAARAGLTADDSKNPLTAYYDHALKLGPKMQPERPRFIDHGVGSALLLLQIWHAYDERVHKYLEATRDTALIAQVRAGLNAILKGRDATHAHVLAAASAIALHNIDKDIWSDDVVACGANIAQFRLFLADDKLEPPCGATPLTFLLTLADTLQDWDRPSFRDIDRPDEVLTDQDMSLRAQDDRILLYFPADDADFKSPSNYSGSKYHKARAKLSSFLDTEVVESVLAWDSEQERNPLVYFRSSDAAPPKYNVFATLSYIAAKRAKLEVIGRTCFRWLGGDENLLRTDPAKFEVEQKRIQDCIAAAVDVGASVSFVLISPAGLSRDVTTREKEDLLRRHFQIAVQSFDSISQRVKNTSNLEMRFVERVVTGMTRVVRGGNTLRFRVDLNTEFATEERSKPCLIFDFEAWDFDNSDIERFDQEFDQIVRAAAPRSSLELDLEKGKKEVHEIIQAHHHHSPLRRDQSAALAAYCANQYRGKKRPVTDSRVPPLCVQLLVTNRCTTKCIMCDHYSLHDRHSELSESEIEYALGYIADIGTKNIIISGGEPLAREGIFEVLGAGKRLGLNIGLLTNGIQQGGKPLSSDDAAQIARSCSWVQLSIDSFKRNVYQSIRGIDGLDAAVESCRMLNAAGVRGLEVCYTIQRDNVEEAAEANERASALIGKEIPLRLKFVHGNNDRGNSGSTLSYLCPEEKIIELVRELRADRANSEYLKEMVSADYFHPKGIAVGMPLQRKMDQFHAKGYKCQVLGLTCKIDATGDVYPCCFLFDDNRAESDWRPKYRLGSLRVGSLVPSLRASKHNVLAEIWYDNRTLRDLRERILPIDESACSLCTRHAYQNNYLNMIQHLLHKYDAVDLAQAVHNEYQEHCTDPIWI